MSDYDFIINNQPKRRGMGLAQGSMQKKLMVFISGAIVLIVVIVLFSSLLNSGRPSASAYVPITVYQEELIRILENLGEMRDQTNVPAYSTLYLAVTSDLQRSNDYLARNGVQITPEQRSPYYYFDLESDLEAAATNNRFDDELTTYIDQAIADYSRALLSLEPTPGQEPLLEEAKQNVIYYNGPAPENSEE